MHKKYWVQFCPPVSFVLFALGVSSLAGSASWAADADPNSGVRKLIRQIQNEGVPLDGSLIIERVRPTHSPGCTGSGSTTTPITISQLPFTSAVVGLSDGTKARITLRSSDTGAEALMSVTSTEPLPLLREWMRPAIEDGKIETREITLELGGGTTVLHNALPLGLEINQAGKKPVFIYRLQSSQLE